MIGIGISNIFAKSRPILGPELIVNGGFDSGDSWSTSGGWTIGSGVAHNDGTNDDQLRQTFSITESITYRVSVTVSNRSSGLCDVNLGRTFDAGTALRLNANGVFTKDIAVGGEGPDIVFYPIATFIADIDNVSVRRVL